MQEIDLNFGWLCVFAHFRVIPLSRQKSTKAALVSFETMHSFVRGVGLMNIDDRRWVGSSRTDNISIDPPS